MKKNLQKIKNKQGFSFIEVMFVVFILSTTLVVFIQVITKSMNHSMESRDSIIAAGLAQEGVELVKNIRDNNWAQKRKAFDSPFPSGSCGIDYNVHKNCDFGSYNLNFDGNFYNHGLGAATKFSRKIAISGSGETKTITSYVVWEETSLPDDSTNCSVSNKCVYATITLTKWGE
jgi:Tfp pilus assembly protein PilV